MADHDIRAYGASGDGQQLDTAAIQAAIDAAHAAGGGRVVIPPGTFLSGSLLLRSGIEFHLSAGAWLCASGDYADYAPEHRSDALSGGLIQETELPRRGFLMAYDASDLSITGPGTIDGNGRAFIGEDTGTIYVMRGPDAYLERPFTLFLMGCEGLRLQDFRLQDAAFWAIRLSGCHGALVRGLTLHTDLKIPNADGLDIDCCHDVRISDCDFICGDDCISLKTCRGMKHYGPVENVVISNCTMVSTSGAVTLGTESDGDIRDVIIQGCTVRRSHRGIAIRPRQPGLVENILVSDCIIETRLFDSAWWGHGEPLHVTAGAWNAQTAPGSVRNVVFRNILCRSESGVLVWEETPGLIEGITFDGVRVEISRNSRWDHRIDLRPNEGNRMERWPVSAFSLVGGADIRLKDCKVAWSGPADPDHAHAISAKRVRGLQVSGLTGAAARPDLATVVQEDVT